MIHLFCGFDQREAIGWHVFVHSVLSRASAPVAIHRLDGCGMPQGSNAFTLSRFLVPWLMGFRGHAIFADGCDMLMLEDVAKLDGLFDDRYPAQVVQHPTYRTRHRIKYLGTDMQCPNLDYPRKNWASLMLINCEHQAWAAATPELLEHSQRLPMLTMEGLEAHEIGALPDCWNRLVDEGQSVEGAAVLHWTAGLPVFENYRNAPGADLWFGERDRMLEHA